MMDGNSAIINLLWELIVLKNIGNKDLKGPLLEEYRKDVKKKCQRDLEHLRLSSRGNNDVANYLLMRLEEYQFDMPSVSSELDQIEQYMLEIFRHLGRRNEEPLMPHTENIEVVIQKVRDVLCEMSEEIRQCNRENDAQYHIKDLENTIQELIDELDGEKHKLGVMERGQQRS